MKEVSLPSGAILKISDVPFSVAKNLYQTLLREIKSVSLDPNGNVADMVKNAFCTGFSSPAIEACLKECFARCLYNNLKLTDETFEPVSARQDYMKVCTEVTKEVVSPFLKSLYADFKHYTSMIENIRA